jgi:uncharacterized protein (TIGR02449 family)
MLHTVGQKVLIMDELFQRLEMRIREFHEKYAYLQHNNRHLKQAESVLLREKEQLLNKHKHAVNHIESMVTRLKSIEGSS